MAEVMVPEDGMLVVDPYGDVILIVGGTSLNESIQVSSHVLSLASTVFKAMFKHHFPEGHRLEAAKGSPVSIDLPEDDSEVTRLACRVLHHQIDNTAEDPSLVVLSKLATFCDKYDCTHSVRPAAHQWLQRHHLKAPLERIQNLLTLSYMFDVPELFSTVTAELVLNHTGSFIECTFKTGWNTLPASLYCEFVPISIILQLRWNQSNFSQ